MKNSWGADFADNGLFKMSFDAFKNLARFYTVQIDDSQLTEEKKEEKKNLKEKIEKEMILRKKSKYGIGKNGYPDQERIIGEGNNKVFSSINEDNGEEVAIKVIEITDNSKKK